MDILIIDDDATVREGTLAAIQRMDHYAEAVESSIMGLTRLKEDKFDLVVLDLLLGAECGMEVLTSIKTRDPAQAVVMFSGGATINAAVEATRKGAMDFIEKPFHMDRLRHVISQLQRIQPAGPPAVAIQTEKIVRTAEPQFQSGDASVQEMFDLLNRAAGSRASILILGPSGTGKSVAARAVHASSQWAGKPFVTVSCPSLSRELLESDLFGHVKGAFTGAITDQWGKVKAAEGGTLFLDEVGELPLELQPKLLRLLQEREYERLGENKPRAANVRIVAATNRDLEADVAAGRFREDLFYRLNVICVTMPSLKDRPSDVAGFAGQYLDFFAARMKRKISGFSSAARDALQNYPWPGNLRELRNCIERAVILARGTELEPWDLSLSPAEFAKNSGVPAPAAGSLLTVEELTNEHIRRVLTANPKVQDASKILGIDAATIYRRIRRMNKPFPLQTGQSSAR